MSPGTTTRSPWHRLIPAAILLVSALALSALWFLGPLLLLRPLQSHQPASGGFERGLSTAAVAAVTLPGEHPHTRLHGLRGHLTPASLLRGRWDLVEVAAWETDLPAAVAFPRLIDTLLPGLARAPLRRIEAGPGTMGGATTNPEEVWTLRFHGFRDEEDHFEAAGVLERGEDAIRVFARLGGTRMESSVHLAGILREPAWDRFPWPELLGKEPKRITAFFARGLRELDTEMTAYLTASGRFDSTVLLIRGTGGPITGLDRTETTSEKFSGGLTWHPGRPMHLVGDVILGPRTLGALTYGSGAYELRWRSDGPVWIYSGPVPFEAAGKTGLASVAIEVETTHPDRRIFVSGRISRSDDPQTGEGRYFEIDMLHRDLAPAEGGWWLREIRIREGETTRGHQPEIRSSSLEGLLSSQHLSRVASILLRDGNGMDE